EPSLSQNLALLAQIAGEEDDQTELRKLTGLELERAEVDPEAGAVDGRAEARQRGQHEQADRGQAEDVLVALQAPVVASQSQQRPGEDRDGDDDPDPLPERVVGVDSVD